MAAQDYLNQLMNDVRTILTGSSDAGIKAALFGTLREFFNDTSSWMEEVSIPYVVDTLDYDVVPVTGTIVRLIAVTDTNGIPQAAIMPTIGVVHFRNAYNTAQTFTATVAKTVSQPLDSAQLPVIPDWLLPVWGGVVLDGILGRMMQQPTKTYSNEKLAIYHLKRFRDGMMQARTAALHRNTYGMQSWRFPQFAPGSQQNGVTSNDTRFT